MNGLFETVQTVNDEALLEMLLMKLPDPIVQDFLRGKLSVADENSLTYRPLLKEEEQLVSTLKEKHPLLCPYLLLRNSHQIAICAAETDTGGMWNHIRQNITTLKTGQAYIFDFIENKDYGLLSVQFEMKDGFIFRVDSWEETIVLLKEAAEIARMIVEVPDTDL